MRAKLITLRYSSTLGGFDDTPLAAFARDKELLAFREHFFSVSEVPHLTCVLLWQDAVVAPAELAEAREIRAASPSEPPRDPPARARARRSSRDRPDPAAGLDETDRTLFNTLREWRTATAREEGVPPFLVFTNRHLLEIVLHKPSSPTALGHVKGIGPGKLKRYGKAILATLHGSSAAAPAPEPVPMDSPCAEATP